MNLPKGSEFELFNLLNHTHEQVHMTCVPPSDSRKRSVELDLADTTVSLNHWQGHKSSGLGTAEHRQGPQELPTPVGEHGRHSPRVAAE